MNGNGSSLPELSKQERHGLASCHYFSDLGQPTKEKWLCSMQAKMYEAAKPHLRHLAQKLGVAKRSLTMLQVGLTDDGFWAFPERDAENRVIGITYRDENGKKWQHTGGHRGLTIPFGVASGSRKLFPESDCLFIPEGASDTAALISCGIRAVGRPNNTGGAPELAEFLERCFNVAQVIVLGERDRKDSAECGNCGNCNSCWPGLYGARLVAAGLNPSNGASAVKMTAGNPLVGVKLPPKGYKDIRAWTQKNGFDGARLVTELEEVDRDVQRQK